MMARRDRKVRARIREALDAGWFNLNALWLTLKRTNPELQIAWPDVEKFAAEWRAETGWKGPSVSVPEPVYPPASALVEPIA